MRSPRLPRSTATAPPPPAGLRERKKAQTRQHISDVATGLFLARGFDAVTMADIAGAADVSVKTIFNYFGSKEDLLFDRQDEVVGSIERISSQRQPGEGLVDAMLRAVQAGYPATPWGSWSALSEEAVRGRRSYYRMVEDHPHLRARVLLIDRRIAQAVRQIVARDLATDEDDPQTLAYAELVHTAYAATGVEFQRSLLAGRPAAEIRDRCILAGTTALRTIAPALPAALHAGASAAAD